MKDKFKILYCEDRERDRNLVEAYITDINTRYDSIDIFVKNIDFDEAFDELKNNVYSLFILDVYAKDGTEFGIEILNYMNNMKISYPTILHTRLFEGKSRIDYLELEKKYNFLEGTSIKGDAGEKLKELTIDIINRAYEQDHFQYDEDDILLRAEILAIGKNNLNKILLKVKENTKNTDAVTIVRMSSGFSGAAVFRLQYSDGRSSVLKISRNINKIKDELMRSNLKYKEFPTGLKIDIQPKSIDEKEVSAFLIENIENGKTLFDWILNNPPKEDICKLFEKIYFEDSMKVHYFNKKSTDKKKFYHIFEKIDDIKFCFVRNAIEELNPIINEYSKFPFNQNMIKNLVLNKVYDNIDASILVGDKFKKELVLCHGDFHSKNIMVIGHGNRVILIDAGGIGYHYWCMDICRLIVDLFISGFDKNRYDFYSLNRIEYYYKVASHIINQKEIKPDGKNDSFIHAINWLIENVQEIYGDSFCSWEFKLGLMKEFLQMSYRVTSIPHSKRTLALLAANNCMIHANEDLSQSVEKE